jgi:hypothetical protein
MRKWFLPLTVLGIGGLGALVLSERGRKAIVWAMERIDEAPDRFSEWNENAQSELDRIQNNLNRLAESLEAVRPVQP